MSSSFFALLVLSAMLSVALGIGIHEIPKSRVPKGKVDDEFANAIITRTSQFYELKLKDRSIKLLNVPDVMQATDYTCGPASLSAVLNYYELVYREAELAKLALTK